VHFVLQKHLTQTSTSCPQSVIKVKLPLCLDRTPRSITLALHGNEWSVTCSGRFPHGESRWYPLESTLGEHRSLDVVAIGGKSLSLPRIEPWSSTSVH